MSPFLVGDLEGGHRASPRTKQNQLFYNPLKVLKHIQDVNTKKTGLKRYIQDGVQDGRKNHSKIEKNPFLLFFWQLYAWNQ